MESALVDGDTQCRTYNVTSRYLVSATGQLHIPDIPHFPGFEDFKGKSVHPADWDEHHDLGTQSGAIIGNGASSLQAIPEIGSRAKSVVVFQRTVGLVIPKNDGKLPKIEQLLYQYVPKARDRLRANVLQSQDAMHELVINQDVRKSSANFCRAFMEGELPQEPELRRLLTPSYPLSCKSVPLSDDFSASVNQPHVIIETRPIRGFTERGLYVGTSESILDLVIFATRFEAQSFLSKLKTTNKSGPELSDNWRKQTHAYRGMMVEDLPNSSMLYGPSINLSHVSVLKMIQAQARYISAMIRQALAAESLGKRWEIFSRLEAVRHYNDVLQSWLQRTVFVDPGCKSWYKTKAGVVVNNWPGTALQYQEELSMLHWQELEVLKEDDTQVTIIEAQNLIESIERIGNDEASPSLRCCAIIALTLIGLWTAARWPVN